MTAEGEDRTPTNPVLFGEAMRKLLGSTPVSTIMVGPVQCVKTDMTRAQAAELMTRLDVSALPVIDAHGTVAGIITKTDVVREDYGDARWAGAAGQIGKFMTPFLLRVRPDDSLALAVTRMKEAHVHHLVVVDHGSHAVGMISAFDFVKWLAHYLQLRESEEGETVMT